MATRQVYSAIATIANGASMSTAVRMTDGVMRGTLMNLSMPSVWTAAVLTMQAIPLALGERLTATQLAFATVAEQDAWPWVNLRDTFQSEYTIQAAASLGFPLPPVDFMGWWAFRFRSGTASLAVAQGAARDISVSFRDFA